MTPPAALAIFIALLSAGFAFYAGRMMVQGAQAYRSNFQTSAALNLSEMFLFLDARKLFRANLMLLVLVFCGALLSGLGVFVALVVSGAIGASPPAVYWLLRRRRRMRAVQQLPDTLLSLSTNLRAGLSLTQALETTIAYEQPPLSQELGLVLRELRVGVAYTDAMDNLYKRVPEVEVQLVTAAMKVSREIGGSLAETLERISDTLRKRLQMEGKIRSLTAQGKLQGLVMSGLPVFLVIALAQMEPRAMHYLFHAWYGWATMAVIAAMVAVGYHFILKIVNIDV